MTGNQASHTRKPLLPTQAGQSPFFQSRKRKYLILLSKYTGCRRVSRAPIISLKVDTCPHLFNYPLAYPSLIQVASPSPRIVILHFPLLYSRFLPYILLLCFFSVSTSIIPTLHAWCMLSRQPSNHVSSQ